MQVLKSLVQCHQRSHRDLAQTAGRSFGENPKIQSPSGICHMTCWLTQGHDALQAAFGGWTCENR